MFRFLLCFTVFLLSFGALATEDLPVAAYAKLPTFRSMNLSPDGSKIVALKAIKETYHAVLIDLTTQKTRMLMASDPEQFLFDSCFFANNERVICRIFRYGVLRAGAIGFGARWYRDGRTIFSRLMAVNVDGSDLLQLVPKVKPTMPGRNIVWNAPNQSTIVNMLWDDEKYILIQLARDDRIYPTVYRLNIYNNKLKRIKRFRTNIIRWWSSDDGKTLLGAGFNRKQEPIAVAYKDGWYRLDLSEHKGELPPEIVGFSKDAKSVWILGNAGENTRGVYRADLLTGKILESVYRHSEFDVAGMVLHPETKLPLAVNYTDEWFERVWFNDDLKNTFEEVQRILPGKPGEVRIMSWNKALNRFILLSQGNGTLPTYYFYDSKSKSLKLVATLYQELGSAYKNEYVEYKSRDGLTIHAYLALPGDKDDGPYGTVILPHGGPYLRDDASFDYWTQMFVDRGYAVLKPNYRGSWGYGDKFLSLGFGEWGLAMQDDLIDGLDWLIDVGITDPNRVCIVGGSYGGYAALVAAYKTPDRFKCAISFAGVADLSDLVNRFYGYLLGRLTIARLPKGKALAENSPLQNVDDIGIPLLLVHGDVDRSVMIEQSNKLAAALEKAGKEFEYIYQENGDHFLSLQSHRTQFLEAMDIFLAKHLKR